MAPPPGFWLGMFVIPAATWAVVCTVSAVVAFIWYSERFALGDWKLWPKRVMDDDRSVLPSIVACAKWTRYLWVPGWHIVICRTTLAGKHSHRETERHRRVRWAIRDALRTFDDEDGDA